MFVEKLSCFALCIECMHWLRKACCTIIKMLHTYSPLYLHTFSHMLQYFLKYLKHNIVNMKACSNIYTFGGHKWHVHCTCNSESIKTMNTDLMLFLEIKRESRRKEKKKENLHFHVLSMMEFPITTCSIHSWVHLLWGCR